MRHEAAKLFGSGCRLGREVIPIQELAAACSSNPMNLTGYDATSDVAVLELQTQDLKHVCSKLETFRQEDVLFLLRFGRV